MTKRVTNDFTNVPIGTPLTLKKEVPTTCVRWSWCFSFFLSLICFRKSVGTDYFENFLNKGPVIIRRLRGAEDFFWGGEGKGGGVTRFSRERGGSALIDRH